MIRVSFWSKSMSPQNHCGPKPLRTTDHSIYMIHVAENVSAMQRATCFDSITPALGADGEGLLKGQQRCTFIYPFY